MALNRNASGSSLQNSLMISNSEGGISAGANNCTPVNGPGVLGGNTQNSNMPSTAAVPSQEFYC